MPTRIQPFRNLRRMLDLKSCFVISDAIGFQKRVETLESGVCLLHRSAKPPAKGVRLRSLLSSRCTRLEANFADIRFLLRWWLRLCSDVLSGSLASPCTPAFPPTEPQAHRPEPTLEGGQAQCCPNLGCAADTLVPVSSTGAASSKANSAFIGCVLWVAQGHQGRLHALRAGPLLLGTPPVTGLGEKLCLDPPA